MLPNTGYQNNKLQYSHYDFFSSFGGLDYNVKFMVEVENYTKFYLSPGQTDLNSGHISEPPSAMFGGEKHGVVGHKTANAATGCAGIDVFHHLLPRLSIQLDRCWFIF